MKRRAGVMIALAVLVLAALAGLAVGSCAGEVGPTPFYSPARPSPSARLTELPAVNWTLTPRLPPWATASPAAAGEGGTAEPVLVYTVTLPAMGSAYTSTQEPPVVNPEVYGCAGEPEDVTWLVERFGAVSWSGPVTATARLSTIRACCGDCAAVIVANVRDEAGEPVEGAAVVFHWPGAPWLPAELYGCGLMRGVYGTTNQNGDVGFGLGGGSYYDPAQGERGPHTVWIGGMSSWCASGIGMLAFTNHEHPDLGWSVAERYVTTAPDVGFSPQCPVYLEDVGGREMWVIRCGP